MIHLNQTTIGYFTTMAQIAATLLGLSFLALTFYLQGTFDRIKLAMPVFRDEDRSKRRAAKIDRSPGTIHQTDDSFLDFPKTVGVGEESTPLQRNPFDLTDIQLFDGDPLVVFLAYSTAVSWNLYFLALVISVTFIGWNPTPVWVIAVEVLAFLALLIYDNAVRRQQYAQLRTYRTREEHMAPILEWLAISIYGVVVLYCCWGAFGWSIPWVGESVSQNVRSFLPWLFVPVLQITCLLAFSAGLYVTNRDMFVYFKAKVSDDMRGKWLDQFGVSYRTLAGRVTSEIAISGTLRPNTERLKVLWNGGRPPRSYFSTAFGIPSDTTWRRLVQGESGRTIAAFMIDVPAIAAWFYDIERCLEDLHQVGVQSL